MCANTNSAQLCVCPTIHEFAVKCNIHMHIYRLTLSKMLD